MWFKVGESGEEGQRPRCSSASTSTRSMTRTVSRCRPGSAGPSRTGSSSRAAWTAASTRTRARPGAASSRLGSPRTTPSRSGTAPPGVRSWRRSKGVRSMLPNVLQPSATDHVPVLAEEVRQALAVQPGQTVVDATFGAGGHSALLAAELQGRGKLIAIDRDPTVRSYFERFALATPVQTRFLRGEFDVVLRQLADNGVQADAVLLDLG